MCTIIETFVNKCTFIYTTNAKKLLLNILAMVGKWDKEIFRPPSSDSQYTSIVFFPCLSWNTVLGWDATSIETEAEKYFLYECFRLRKKYLFITFYWLESIQPAIQHVWLRTSGACFNARCCRDDVNILWTSIKAWIHWNMDRDIYYIDSPENICTTVTMKKLIPLLFSTSPIEKLFTM